MMSFIATFRIALAILLTLVATVAAVASPAEREKSRLDNLRDRREGLERQLKESESSRAETQNRLRDTEKSISAVARRLHALGEERSASRQELGERERELRQLERLTTGRQDQLARLLRYQFRPQQADAFAVLLAGGDPNAAARDRYFLTLLSRAKAELIADLRRDAKATRQLADEVRDRNEKLAELARREEQERSTLQQRQQERQAMLAKLSGQIKAQRKEIDTLRQNEERLAKLIDTLVKRASKPAPPPPKAARGRGKEAQSAKLPDAEPAQATGTFARLRGRLPFPVKGSIAAHFGKRRDDGQSIWKGLFMRAAEGAEVRAVAAGTVVFADWLRGYGNLIIVDHDDDFLSVYGNNQSLLADAGKKVTAGARLATVGSSGGQAESGLYFELRHRGMPFDPARWLGAP